MKTLRISLNLLLVFSGFTAGASAAKVPVIASSDMLREAGIEILQEDKELGLGFARLTEKAEQKLSEIAHARKMCGGFQVLDESEVSSRSLNSIFTGLKQVKARDLEYTKNQKLNRTKNQSLEIRPEIAESLKKLEVENLKTWVSWLTSFKNRHSKAKDPNVHVRELEAKLKNQFADSKIPFEVSMIPHQKTNQQTLRFRIIGKEKPLEHIILGAHLDSISNQGVHGSAPGADDDASGVANILEVLRVIMSQGQPNRSMEFLFYAAEEAGLIGSTEVARSYKKENKNVVGVFQLDMTLFPASGKNIVGLTRDFTTPSLNELVEGLNANYVKAKIIDDNCGYACSDHASWYREGFPVTYPFEGGNGQINGDIHTPGDTVNHKSDFEHSLVFSQLALAFAMELDR